MIVDWPVHKMRMADPAIAFEWLNRPDQDATNGMFRSVGLTGARLRVRMIGIAVYDESTARTFRSLLGQIKGSTNLVRFVLPDLYGLDGPFSNETRAAREQYPKGIPHSTGAMFLTGVGYQVPLRSGIISAAANLNAETIQLQEVPVGIGGCYVSIEDFVYTVTHRADGNGIVISPGLHREIVAGTVIRYAPRFVGKLLTRTPGYEAMKQGLFGLHELEFVEDTTRARLPYSPD